MTQTLMQAEVAFSMGMIDTHQREVVEKMQHDVVDLVRAREWKQARKLGDAINEYITNCSGSASLEDIRRCGLEAKRFTPPPLTTTTKVARIGVAAAPCTEDMHQGHEKYARPT